MSVIVNAIQRVCSSWRQANIIYEHREVLPSYVNLYASPTIVFILSIRRVRTTSLHIRPSTILFSAFASTIMPVLKRMLISVIKVSHG